MSNQQPKSRPSHRVSFARIIGQDENGNDKLGSAREIGGVWPRQNGKGFCGRSLPRVSFWAGGMERGPAWPPSRGGRKTAEPDVLSYSTHLAVRHKRPLGSCLSP